MDRINGFLTQRSRNFGSTVAAPRSVVIDEDFGGALEKHVITSLHTVQL
jgi:hypothetical protein